MLTAIKADEWSRVPEIDFPFLDGYPPEKDGFRWVLENVIFKIKTPPATNRATIENYITT
jgi:hypothetical protein